MYFKFIVFILLLSSCVESVRLDKKNIFFIRYRTNDSLLKNELILASRNKVTYYDSAADIFRVIPINYKTNESEDMHYFFTEDQSTVKLEDGIVLYDIEVKESDRLDSTSFSVKKLVYAENTWKPKSEMGWINVFFPQFTRAIAERKRKKLADYIIQTIAKDSYTF